jgi:sulfur carrier protein
MKVHLNGEPTEVVDDDTVAAVIERLGLQDRRVAVELNRALLARERWKSTALHAGDSLEIVQFVGGG